MRRKNTIQTMDPSGDNGRQPTIMSSSPPSAPFPRLEDSNDVVVITMNENAHPDHENPNEQQEPQEDQQQEEQGSTTTIPTVWDSNATARRTSTSTFPPPHQPPPPHRMVKEEDTSPVVPTRTTCEEQSDEGSLFRSCTIWTPQRIALFPTTTKATTTTTSRLPHPSSQPPFYTNATTPTRQPTTPTRRSTTRRSRGNSRGHYPQQQQQQQHRHYYSSPSRGKEVSTTRRHVESQHPERVVRFADAIAETDVTVAATPTDSDATTTTTTTPLPPTTTSTTKTASAFTAPKRTQPSGTSRSGNPPLFTTTQGSGVLSTTPGTGIARTSSSPLAANAAIHPTSAIYGITYPVIAVPYNNHHHHNNNNKTTINKVFPTEEEAPPLPTEQTNATRTNAKNGSVTDNYSSSAPSLLSDVESTNPNVDDKENTGDTGGNDEDDDNDDDDDNADNESLVGATPSVETTLAERSGTSSALGMGSAPWVVTPRRQYKKTCSNSGSGHAKEEGYNHAGSNRSSSSSSSSFYTRTGAPDSPYRVYAVDVDPTHGDRAADIVLCCMARPHMRAFHLAWMSFFVAFFTWFAMTPLLAEIASTCHFSRQEIFTSSVLAVISSGWTRLWIGPLNDTYGARWVMCWTLVAAAIPTVLAAFVLKTKLSLYLIRLGIGMAGSSFVTCQYWTSSMFTNEIAGTANALTAGWGNLGGGVASIFMGSFLFPLAKIAYGGRCFWGCASTDPFDDDDIKGEPGEEYDRPAHLAWRTVMLFPASLSLVMAYIVIRFGDDTPKGNIKYHHINRRENLSHPAPPPSPLVTVWENFKKGAVSWNTYLLSFQYGCCFGVEITIIQAVALYFADEFGQSTESAAAIASVFGWMNLFARGIGGYLSDLANAYYGLRGRLWCQVGLLILEGCFLIIFSHTQSLAQAIVTMVFCSILVQSAEGSTFGIVPYVDSTVMGSVSGLVGAGGNVGGAIFTLIFVHNNYSKAFFWMGVTVVFGAFTTALIDVPENNNLFCGYDSEQVIEHRQNTKPPAIIMIPVTTVNEPRGNKEEGQTVADEQVSHEF